MTFIVRGLAADVVERVRSTRHADAGEPAELWISDGPGNPCRSCLRLTETGTALLLFAYRPFTFEGPYAESGPIFVHADACAAYTAASEFPPDFRMRSLTLRGNSHAGRIVDAMVAQPGGAESGIARLFADPSIAFIHARSPSWGCYDFEIRRGGTA